MNSPENNIDGLYRHRWDDLRFGRSTVYFNVKDGRIETSPHHVSIAPVGEFNGKKLAEFTGARLDHNWPHYGDTCIQVM